ncbi:VOC family protein [Kitasatospora sp. NPDC048298]|uniref:VOC family protein n=1 Tax=Kitasatospora sp. NPDC048298 TaxID=3364049 RepID=UPI00372148F0
MLGDAPLQAVVPATDLARAKGFYTGTLGLKLTEEGEEEFVCDSGGTQFTVYRTPAVVRQPTPSPASRSPTSTAR